MPDPNPCTPIPKVYPPGATQTVMNCIDAAYTQYLNELDGCSGDHSCCQQARINYENARAQCIGET